MYLSLLLLVFSLIFSVVSKLLLCSTIDKTSRLKMKSFSTVRDTQRVNHNFLIHLSADGHLGFFHVLAIINSAVMNIGVQVSLSILVSLVYMPSSGIAGSYGSSISSF